MWYWILPSNNAKLVLSGSVFQILGAESREARLLMVKSAGATVNFVSAASKAGAHLLHRD